MRRSSKIVVSFASAGFLMPWAITGFYATAHQLNKFPDPGPFLLLWPSQIQLLLLRDATYRPDLELGGWLFIGSIINALLYVAIPFAIVVIYRFSRRNSIATHSDSH
jgi:hypothetical protein